MKRLLSLSFMLGLAACSRTPPEPSPVPAPMAAEPARATTTSSRCIAKLPDTAPKIPAPAESCPTDPEAGGPKLARAEVTFSDAPSAPRIEVEIAKSRREVERGLMYRRSMPDDQGMLFKMDMRREQTFWMRNTCIPLDMLFLDEDGTIVGIVEGAAPLTDTTRSVGCPSLFVLEVNGGWVRRHGVAPGQKITIPFSAR